MPTAGKLCEFVQAAFQKRFIYGEYLQIVELNAADAPESADPVLRKTYQWGPLEPVATRILAMSVFDETGTYVEDLYYTHDALKNTTALFGIKAGRRALYEYGPYGSAVKMEGNAAELNPFRFSSEYADDELGLVYYNYRYYNPQNGRWVSRDPIGEFYARNLYEFVNNNPLIRFDYIGLDMIPWAIDPSVISQAGFAWADLQRQLEEAAKTEEQRKKEKEERKKQYDECVKRCDDQRQASSEELNRKTEDTHSKAWEDMMKTSKECDESRWDRAIKLLSESLGAAQACSPVNGPPIRYNPDCLGSSIPKGVGQFITVASIQAKYNECVENCKKQFPHV